jgi:uncharacterized protein YdhG (YjbR/CyaY superfamily)
MLSVRAASQHCSFFPGAHLHCRPKQDLKAYKTSKGTIQFQPDKPPPAVPSES